VQVFRGERSKPMSLPITFDYAVHSDYLIHWTGKDIDRELDSSWYDEHLSERDPAAPMAKAYIKRLQDVLRYGLWMTEEAPETFRVGDARIEIPATPQCCFTELKLSESRRHARQYGRLGIGVKRGFLFQRFGRPLAYFGFGKDSHNDRFLEACSRELSDRKLLNFFKPMNSSLKPLNYDLYSESEWRILFFEDLLKSKRLVDPRDSANVPEHRYFNSLTQDQQQQLKYLVPLDGWFGLIIYPALAVKNMAQWDESSGIRDEIRKIKGRADRGNNVEGLKNPTRGNWPIEVDLNACRHF
jgi:hypothetical protein